METVAVGTHEAGQTERWSVKILTTVNLSSRVGGGNAGEEDFASDQLDCEALEQMLRNLVLVPPVEEATMEPSLVMTRAASGCQTPRVSIGSTTTRRKPSAAQALKYGLFFWLYLTERAWPGVMAALETMLAEACSGEMIVTSQAEFFPSFQHLTSTCDSGR